MARKKINIKPKSGNTGSNLNPSIRNRKTNQHFNQPTKVPDIKAPGKIEQGKPKKKKAPQKKKSGCGFMFLSIAIIGSLVYFFFFYDGDLDTLMKRDKEKSVKTEKPEKKLASDEYPFELNDYRERNERKKITETTRFTEIMRDVDVSQRNREKILNEIRQKYRKSTVNKGEFLYFSHKKRNVIDYIVYEPGAEDALCIILTPPVGVKILKRTVETTTRVETFVFNNADRMNAEIPSKGFPIDFLSKFEEMLKYTVDFYGIVDGNRFKVVYEEIEEDRGDRKVKSVGRILACEIETLEETKYVYGFNTGKGFEYFDNKDESVERPFIKSPLKAEFRITSEFGPRNDPMSSKKKAQFHKGTDFAAKTGTPVHVIGSGRVLRTGDDQVGGGGNFIVIEHDVGQYVTKYLHLSKIEDFIVPNARVNKGDKIGEVGMTGGRATGPHLCLQLWDDDHVIDFFSKKFSASESIPNKYRSTFQKEKKNLQKLMDGEAY